MKSWLWKGMLAAVVALPAASGVARAQSNDNDGCTNATLKGDCAFSVVNFTQPLLSILLNHQLVWASRLSTARDNSPRKITKAIAFGPRARPVFERVRPATR